MKQKMLGCEIVKVLIHKKHKAALVVLQALLICCWIMRLSPLVTTDTYYSVYLLCAAIGLVCLFLNDKHSEEKNTCGKQTIVFAGCSFLFSAAVLLANYKLYFALPLGEKLLFAVTVFSGGFAVGYNILCFCADRFPCAVGLKSERKNAAAVFFMGLVVMTGIYWLYLFYAAYPGNMTPDSFTSLTQIQTGSYANNNPYWHTQLIRVFMNVGYLLCGDINGAVATYSALQSILLAACFAYVIVTLYQANMPGWIMAAVFVIYALMPYNIAFSVTLWKDVLFSSSILLTVNAIYRIQRNIGAWKWLNYVCFAIGAIGFCLLRTNGWFAFLVTGVILGAVLRPRNRYLVFVICVILVVCWILTNPVLDALQVKPTDLVEALAIPFQQVARVITHGYELHPDDYALLEKVFDVSLIPEIFSHGIVDPIKGIAMRAEQKPYFLAHLGEYAALWLRLGKQHFSEYLKAWIELTKGYWNAGYEYWVYYEGGMNESLGIVRGDAQNLVGEVFRRYFDFIDAHEIFQPLYSIGLHVWTLFACLAINVVKKRKEWILTIPGVVIILGLWLGTPVFAEFRYAYPVFLTLPLILAVTLFSPEEQSAHP